MITPSNIIQHLKTYLPVYTDRFTDNLTISSSSVDVSNILTVNATAHGLTIGKNIIITAGTTRNPLTASLLDGDTVKFTTVYDHDLIKPSKPLDDQTLTLAGFTGSDTVWNGEHDIIDVPNRRNFIINLPTGETLAPTVNESQYLIDKIFKGLYEVDTTPTVDQFTLDLSDSPSYPVGTVDSLNILSGFRMSAVADFERAKAIYSQQTNAYLFVVMTDGDVSKDRHTMNDSVASFTSQTFNKLNLIRNFSTIVFIPTDDDISGADAQDIVYGELYTDLLATLFGYAFGGGRVEYSAVPAGDGPAEYNSAYYAHTYDWQIPDTITYEDGFLPQDDVAFRDIVQTLQLFADEEAEMESNIDLDEDEL